MRHLVRMQTSFLTLYYLTWVVVQFWFQNCLNWQEPKEEGEEGEDENNEDEEKDKKVNQEFLLCAFDCLGQSWPKNATDSQGKALQPMLNFWARWCLVKSLNYTMKYSLFSQAELSQVAFSLVPTNSQSLAKDLLVERHFVTVQATNKYYTLPLSHAYP